jgi:steroid 5-alpha reductase family enzyme
MRHPQYVGFILVMIGFLVEWPTLITLLMFPVLLRMYIRLARREEKAIGAEFTEFYAEYGARVPAFFPHLPRTWPRKWRRSGGKEADGRGPISTTRMPTGGENE